MPRKYGVGRLTDVVWVTFDEGRPKTEEVVRESQLPFDETVDGIFTCEEGKISPGDVPAEENDLVVIVLREVLDQLNPVDDGVEDGKTEGAAEGTNAAAEDAAAVPDGPGPMEAPAEGETPDAGAVDEGATTAVAEVPLNEAPTEVISTPEAQDQPAESSAEVPCETVTAGAPTTEGAEAAKAEGEPTA